MGENHIGYQIGDFTLYMDDKTGLYGISDSDGNIIVEAEYNSKDEMGEIYKKLVLGEIDQLDIDERYEFLEDYGIDTLTVCDNCGKLIHEGYTLAGLHACCDDCAIALYCDKDGNVYPDAEELFKRDIEENSVECYWTAWEG